MFRQTATIKNDILRVAGYVVAYDKGYFFHLGMVKKLAKLLSELAAAEKYFESLEEEE